MIDLDAIKARLLDDDECGDGFRLHNEGHSHNCNDFDRMRDIAALVEEVERLTAEVQKAKNMARHNYRCAVHEQLHTYAQGGTPSTEYPPQIDDEFTAALARAEQAEAEVERLRQQELELIAFVCREADAAYLQNSGARGCLSPQSIQKAWAAYQQQQQGQR